MSVALENSLNGVNNLVACDHNCTIESLIKYIYLQ